MTDRVIYSMEYESLKPTAERIRLAASPHDVLMAARRAASAGGDADQILRAVLALDLSALPERAMTVVARIVPAEALVWVVLLDYLDRLLGGDDADALRAVIETLLGDLPEATLDEARETLVRALERFDEHGWLSVQA